MRLLVIHNSIPYSFLFIRLFHPNRFLFCGLFGFPCSLKENSIFLFSSVGTYRFGAMILILRRSENVNPWRLSMKFYNFQDSFRYRWRN